MFRRHPEDVAYHCDGLRRIPNALSLLRPASFEWVKDGPLLMRPKERQQCIAIEFVEQLRADAWEWIASDGFRIADLPDSQCQAILRHGSLAARAQTTPVFCRPPPFLTLHDQLIDTVPHGELSAHRDQPAPDLYLYLPLLRSNHPSHKRPKSMEGSNLPSP